MKCPHCNYNSRKNYKDHNWFKHWQTHYVEMSFKTTDILNKSMLRQLTERRECKP